MSAPIKHYTASIIILTDEKPTKVLLVHHRKFDKWVQPGGHQEPWENSLETAIREAKEETGLDITKYLDSMSVIDEIASCIPRPNYILEEKIAPHKDQAEHYHLDMNYVVRVPEQAVSHRAEESHDIGWFTMEQIEALPAFENLRYVLRQELTK